MRKMQITVDGQTYEVTVVQDSGRDQPPASEAPAQPDAVAATAPRQAAATSPSPKVSGDGHRVTAPLAGSIRAVAVKAGDQVAQGEVLLTLEALKLENEIVAPVSGQVESVVVGPGDEVTAGQVLVVIAPAGGPQAQQQQPTPVATRAAASDDATPPEPEGHSVTAPLAGSILSVSVGAGDEVRQGDVMLTLEALKLENEIVAPVSGRVVAVLVKAGDEVPSGHTLVVIAT